MARYYVREKVDAQAVGEVDWNPASGGGGFLGLHTPSAVRGDSKIRSVVFDVGWGPYGA